MISVFFEFLIRGLIWIFKCIFDMILFFLRQLFRLLRLFLALLPVTTVVYSFFFCFLTIEVIAGENIISSLLPIQIDSTEVKDVIVSTLRGYLSILSGYSGTLMYFLLFIIMLILSIPLFLVFVGVGTFVYVGRVFVITLLVDLVLYFIRCVISGKSPFDIISSRCRILFPEMGRRMNERSYNRWLRRHRDEFENDTFGKTEKRSPLEEFYAEDPDDEDEDYDDEDYDDEEEYYPEEEYDEDEYYPDEDYYEDEEDDDFDEYYDDRIEDRHSRRDHHHEKPGHTSSDISAFNFFAGCTTLESATKKYKTLVKLYHPDNMDGDTAALQEINMQYNEIKRRLS